jgi:hypothetical protein
MAKKRKPKHKYVFVEEIPSYYHTSSFNLEIKDSQIKQAGLGLFTKDTISENTLIDNYNGNKQRLPTSKYFFHITDDVGIDAGSYPRCYMGMLNDSFNSNFKNNCEFRVDEEKQTVSVWSLRQIEAGEELFISYGDTYWQ